MKSILIVLILFSSSCKSNKTMTKQTENKITTQLEMSKNTFQLGETISIRFSVQNNTKTPFEFCYWHTPLEKRFTANYFEIIHKGTVLDYKGKMLKRKPATKEDYNILKPEEKTTQSININDAYNLDKLGIYTIRFLGRTINGLPDSEPIHFTINN